MNSNTFTDIFATKGIEYLIVIAFLMLLIPFWMVLNHGLPARQQIRRTVDLLLAGLQRIPAELLYSHNHTWAFLQRSGTARVGLDDFLLNLTGEVSVTPLKPSGSYLEKGELMAILGQNGKTLRVYAPISGEVVEANQVHSLGMDNHLDKNWIYGIRPVRWVEESSLMMVAGETAGWFRKEVERLKDMLAFAQGGASSDPALVALQEGGELRSNLLTELHEEVWAEFQEKFLDG